MNKLVITLFTLLISASLHSVEINYSFNLSNDIRDTFIQDFITLKNISFDPSENNELQRIMKLDELTGTHVSNWIDLRTNYIVEEDFNKNDEDVFTLEGYDSTGPDISMTNYGAAIFAAANRQNLEAGFNFVNLNNEKIEVMVSSPRVGLLKVGPILFSPLHQINDDITSYPNMINRLRVVAHEARHSDGNNASLGFRHEKCPETHYLAGRLACDTATNGAYAVSSQFLKELTKTCLKKCDTIDKQMLLMIVLDNAARIIKTDSLNDLDDTPIELGVIND